jgi:hypothetical protein
MSIRIQRYSTLGLEWISRSGTRRTPVHAAHPTLSFLQAAQETHGNRASIPNQCQLHTVLAIE